MSTEQLKKYANRLKSEPCGKVFGSINATFFIPEMMLWMCELEERLQQIEEKTYFKIPKENVTVTANFILAKEDLHKRYEILLKEVEKECSQKDKSE